MNALISFCLKNRITVVLISLILAALSIFVVATLPVDVFPELKQPRVTIQTEAGGLTAEEVEQYVSIPLESAMQGTPGVRNVSSSSGGGLSFVWVDFDWGTDIYLARQIVSERLATVRESLPSQVETEMAPIVSVTGEIMVIAIQGDATADPLEVRRVAEFELRNRLLAIPGVGQVTVLGGRLPEYQVAYDPEKMRQAGVSFADLKNTVESAQSSIPAGYLEDVAGVELPVQQNTRAFTTEHLKRAIVTDHPTDGVVRLEHVADVKIDGAPRRGNAGYARADGVAGAEAVVLSVQKVPGANTLELTYAVDAAVKEFEKSRLPKNMKMYADGYRQADFIELSLENGKETLIIAAIVVVVVIMLTLLNFRTAMITLISMPFSVLLGMAVFPIFGLGVNIMTLGGLAVAVGDVVDNAIIFVEIAWRALSRNAAKPKEKQKSRYRVLMEAKKEIVSSITFSSLIILLVFAPLLFLGGIEGQFYRPLGISYMLALAASLLVALTLIPTLCIIFYKPGKKIANNGGDSASARFIKRVYTPILNFCLAWPKSVFGSLMLITGGALWLGSTYGTSFLPPFNEDCYTLFVNAVPGTSLEETERISRQVMQNVRQIDGVKTVTQRTGRAENDEHAEPVSASELVVRVDLSKDQRRMREQFKEAMRGIPGVSGMVGFPIAHRISSALSNSNSEIAINIFGDDLPQIRAAAKKAAEILADMPEVADARANREVMVDTIHVDYNREVLAAYGLSMADAADQVSAAFNGMQVGEVIRNLDHWDIVLRLDADLRRNVDDVRNLQLVAPGGKKVPLGEVAHVYRAETTNLILRDNSRRKAMISCNPAPDSNLGDLAKACREKLDPAMNEMGCTVEYAGTIKSREAAGQRLYMFGGIVCVLIVLLLSGSLGSVRRALVTLINIPLCLVGGIIAVFLASPETVHSVLSGTGYVHPILSVSSIVGFVTVVGFAIRSGLILLNRYRALELGGLSIDQAIRVGSTERVIPIMMTSLTTILGLLPLIWAKDQPGGELLAPLAIVQFGGLVSATVLNLLVIPATCKIFARFISAGDK
ncbi:MAG: efflux RND transporter permease subunit [Akkermansiaceae bacterium]|nr:efflux RND transporter permease subunit [Akkermansiaceae bacterium]